MAETLPPGRAASVSRVRPLATSKVDLTVPVTSEVPCFCAALQASFRLSTGVP